MINLNFEDVSVALQTSYIAPSNGQVEISCAEMSIDKTSLIDVDGKGTVLRPETANAGSGSGGGYGGNGARPTNITDPTTIGGRSMGSAINPLSDGGSRGNGDSGNWFRFYLFLVG